MLILCRCASDELHLYCVVGMDFHELLDIPHGDRRKYHDDVSVMVISLEGRIWRSSGWIFPIVDLSQHLMLLQFSSTRKATIFSPVQALSLYVVFVGRKLWWVYTDCMMNKSHNFGMRLGQVSCTKCPPKLIWRISVPSSPRKWKETEMSLS